MLELLRTVSEHTLVHEVTRVRPGQLVRLAPGRLPEVEVVAAASAWRWTESDRAHPWYRITLADPFACLVCRSGGAVATHGDEVVYQAPGADAKALDFPARTPASSSA